MEEGGKRLGPDEIVAVDGVVIPWTREKVASLAGCLVKQKTVPMPKNRKRPVKIGDMYEAASSLQDPLMSEILVHNNHAYLRDLK